jgi:hypothetical protein
VARSNDKRFVEKVQDIAIGFLPPASSCSVLSTTCLIASAVNGGLRPGRVASRRKPAMPLAR